MRAMCDLAADAFWKVQAVGKAFERLKSLRLEKKLLDRADEHRRKVLMKRGLRNFGLSSAARKQNRSDEDVLAKAAAKCRMSLALRRMSRNVKIIKRNGASNAILARLADAHKKKRALHTFVRRVAMARGRRISAAVESVRWKAKSRIVRGAFCGWREFAREEGIVRRHREYWGQRTALARLKEAVDESKRIRRKERLARGFHRGCAKLKAFVGWRAVTIKMSDERLANEIADTHFTRKVFKLLRGATEERKAQRQKGFGRMCRAWDGWVKVVEDQKEVRRKEDVAMGHWRLRLKANALLSMQGFTSERRKMKRKEAIANSLWRNKVR